MAPVLQLTCAPRVYTLFLVLVSDEGEGWHTQASVILAASYLLVLLARGAGQSRVVLARTRKAGNLPVVQWNVMFFQQFPHLFAKLIRLAHRHGVCLGNDGHNGQQLPNLLHERYVILLDAMRCDEI